MLQKEKIDYVNRVINELFKTFEKAKDRVYQQVGKNVLKEDMVRVIQLIMLGRGSSNQDNEVFSDPAIINFRNTNTRTAFYIAFYQTHPLFVNYLCELGVDFIKKLGAIKPRGRAWQKVDALLIILISLKFFDAVSKKNIVVVKRFISMGVLPYVPQELLLLFSVKNSSALVVDVLLNQGLACVNYCDNDGKTPLYYAFKKQNLSMIHQLFFREAVLTTDIVSLAQSGLFATDIMELFEHHYKEDLYLAVICDDVERVSALWFDGAQQVLNKYNFYPLHIGVSHNSKKVVRYLIDEKELNVNQIDRMGFSCLGYAVKAKNSFMVDLLLHELAEIDPGVMRTLSFFGVENFQSLPYEKIKIAVTFQLLEAIKVARLETIARLLSLNIVSYKEVDLIEYAIRNHPNNTSLLLKVFVVLSSFKKDFSDWIKRHFDEQFQLYKKKMAPYGNIRSIENKYIKQKIELHKPGLQFLMRCLYFEYQLLVGNNKKAALVYHALQKQRTDFPKKYLSEIFQNRAARQYTLLKYSKELLRQFDDISVLRGPVAEMVANEGVSILIKLDYVDLLIARNAYDEAYQFIAPLVEKFSNEIAGFLSDRLGYYVAKETKYNCSTRFFLPCHSSKSVALRFFISEFLQDKSLQEFLKKENMRDFDRLLKKPILYK